MADDNVNDKELKLTYHKLPISLGANKKVTKLIQVNIGSRLFHYKPVDLFFREACYDKAQFQQQLFYGRGPRVTLQNVQNEKGSFLEFVKPCPEVEWAGELKRDQSFLVNKKSDNVNELQILIRNPDFSSGKFQDKKRLESIFLWYRRVGDVVWSKALGKISDGAATQTKELDFFKYGKEDSYGFITNLKWLLRGGVIEGAYEIKVECICFAAGGPKDYNISSTMSLIGVYDVTAPKLFGSPLPLDDVVLIGEEITLVFTEPLQCSKPYSFDIEMRLYGSSTGNIPLQVLCEGNHVCLQVDQDKYNVANLMGKKFVVEVGTIGSQSSRALTDTNGNPLEYNLKCNKTFANLDLSQASNSFEFVLDNVICTDSTVGALQDKILESIRVILGMSSIERIQVIDLNCVDNKKKVAATVSITPSNVGARRFLSSKNKEDDNSVNLFYAYQDASAEKKPISRMLSTGVHDSISNNHFIVRGIKISPGLADVALLTKNATLLQAEKKIRDFEKTFHLNSLNSNSMNDLAIHLLDEVKSQVQEEQLSLQSLLKHVNEQDAEMRKMKTTYEAEILEHKHLHEAELKKMHEEEVKMHKLDSMEMKTFFLETVVVMVATISLAVGLLFLLNC